ncbi:MAG: TRIC cation channel family protein [Firmicutes bacterium]|nr:TRIC cation channel family protein [Bacillota bacterium]
MIYTLELIGTIAFAISGASVGIKKKMDILGVAVLAMTTAVGGGILRDLIINVVPPAAFRDPTFTVTAIAVGLIAFLPPVREDYRRKAEFYEKVLLVTDALGLGIFTAIGIQAAYSAIPWCNGFLAGFVGVLTGVGGGVMRDVMAGEQPYIFVKHFYASASILGAVYCVLTWDHMSQAASLLSCTAVVVLLRILAAKYRWKLPKAE